LLRDRGLQPGILTRGYGRNSPVRVLALPAGASVRTEESGDEPQIFLRSRIAPVGIGADRYRSGAALHEKFGAAVMLLDDGFQHVKLARDFDLVLIDALNPFGGGGVFPMGRLREPPAGLARADAILITRSEAGDLVPAIEREIRLVNPSAPIFHAHIMPEHWVEHRTGRTIALGDFAVGEAGVFSGLGNPGGFYRTLEGLGIHYVDCVEFEDHHGYRPSEVRHMASQFRAKGAKALLTTEKDAVNLCDDCNSLIAPLTLYWLKISMRIEGEAVLLKALEGLVAK
jgi:tetraacyldisaccharide 4'-kinase